MEVSILILFSERKNQKKVALQDQVLQYKLLASIRSILADGVSEVYQKIKGVMDNRWISKMITLQSPCEKINCRQKLSKKTQNVNSMSACSVAIKNSLKFFKSNHYRAHQTKNWFQVEILVVHWTALVLSRLISWLQFEFSKNIIFWNFQKSFEL